MTLDDLVYLVGLKQIQIEVLTKENETYRKMVADLKEVDLTKQEKEVLVDGPR